MPPALTARRPGCLLQTEGASAFIRLVCSIAFPQDGTPKPQ